MNKGTIYNLSSSSSSMLQSPFSLSFSTQSILHHTPFLLPRNFHFLSGIMIISRTAARTARGLRNSRVRSNIRHAHFESSATTQQAAKTGGSSGFAGGIAGGALVFAVSIVSFYVVPALLINICQGRLWLLLHERVGRKGPDMLPTFNTNHLL